MNHSYLDLPSPSGSYYVYGENEYFDPSTSESQSEIASPYDIGNFVMEAQEGQGQEYPSPQDEAEIGNDETAAQLEPTKTPAKRKRENRYKNASPSVLSRRRAQNRASQRAYRERKDQKIKDLEEVLEIAKATMTTQAKRILDLEGHLMQYAHPYGAITAASRVPGPIMSLPITPSTSVPSGPSESFPDFGAGPGQQGMPGSGPDFLTDYGMGSMYGPHL